MKKYRQSSVGAGSPQPTADSSARPLDGIRADESAMGCGQPAPTLD